VIRSQNDHSIAPAARRAFELDIPLDVRATLAVVGHGARGLCVRRAHDGLWRATRTPAGPATVHIDDRLAHPHQPGGRVIVEAWGPGAEWSVAHAPDLLGLHDDLTGFRPHHPVVAETHRRRQGLRLCRTNALTEALVPIILEQKVQSIAAHRSWRGLVRRYGDLAPGPVPLTLPPAPERLAALRYETFHRFNVERRRAETIRRVCARSHAIEALVVRPAPEVDARLRSISGVGPWTAASAIGLALGCADAVVVGDYHLPHLVTYSLAGEPKGSDDRMLELLSAYAGHRARVQRLLTLGGSAPPRRGPRLSVMDFSRR
jgi:3-methyladenine DNA glycosylase/8-oxoguanine DNA glycosylase